jgi:hypothetical protein
MRLLLLIGTTSASLPGHAVVREQRLELPQVLRRDEEAAVRAHAARHLANVVLEDLRHEVAELLRDARADRAATVEMEARLVLVLRDLLAALEAGEEIIDRVVALLQLFGHPGVRRLKGVVHLLLTLLHLRDGREDRAEFLFDWFENLFGGHCRSPPRSRVVAVATSCS